MLVLVEIGMRVTSFLALNIIRLGLVLELQDDKANMIASITPGLIVSTGMKSYKTIELY